MTSNLNRTLTTAALLSAVLAGTAGAEPRADGVRHQAVAEAFAAYSLRGGEGEAHPLSALEGEVLVVNFWASWCKPCRKELPKLDELHASIADRGGRVLAVSIDHEARDAWRFAEKLRLRLPIFHDGPEGLVSHLDVPAIPFTLVVDRAGKVVHTLAGADPERLEELATLTRELVARKPLTPGREGDRR